MVVIVNRKGYTVIELIIVMILFGVVTAITISATSYAFKDNSEEFYRARVKNIESNAKRYGMTLDEVKTEGSKIIIVNDLVESGYLSADNEKGDIIDPRNSKATLNNVKIKITYSDKKGYKATLIKEE